MQFFGPVASARAVARIRYIGISEIGVLEKSRATRDRSRHRLGQLDAKIRSDLVELDVEVPGFNSRCLESGTGLFVGGDCSEDQIWFRS